MPDARIGSNFVLRLDEATLPQGWAVTTDNPRSIRLTRGKMSELNFGVSEVDVINLQIDGRAFARRRLARSRACWTGCKPLSAEDKPAIWWSARLTRLRRAKPRPLSPRASLAIRDNLQAVFGR